MAFQLEVDMMEKMRVTAVPVSGEVDAGTSILFIPSYSILFTLVSMRS